MASPIWQLLIRPELRPIRDWCLAHLGEQVDIEKLRKAGIPIGRGPIVRLAVDMLAARGIPGGGGAEIQEDQPLSGAGKGGEGMNSNGNINPNTARKIRRTHERVIELGKHAEAACTSRRQGPAHYAGDSRHSNWLAETQT